MSVLKFQYCVALIGGKGHYYTELPPHFSDGIDDEMAGYDIEVVDYDDSLAEYYNLVVGIPRAINITDLGLNELQRAV